MYFKMSCTGSHDFDHSISSSYYCYGDDHYYYYYSENTQRAKNLQMETELVLGKKYERGENWPLKIGTSYYGKWIWEKNLDFPLHFDTLGIVFLEGQE